jgi:predicted DNA-binding protein YlxM (UPF0122 family)
MMGNIYADVSEQVSRGKAHRRDSIDILCSRVGLLAGMDRVLMTMHFRNGTSFRQIAKLTGASAASVGRRINKLTRRLLEGEYLICLRNRDMFNSFEIDIAKDYFLADLSVREIAVRHGASRYNIQKTVKKIEKLIAVIKEDNPELA